LINPAEFIESLQKFGIDFFVGVPDSLLKELCQTLQHGPHRHMITANEGNAVAMAIGHHLATGRHAAVYMQNSGLGNAINPLVSLAAPEIYRVGMLLIIGWRGEPGVKDEPQHLLQGQITPELLKTMRIPFSIIDSNSNSAEIIDELLGNRRLANGPAALLVRKGTFAAAPADRSVAAQGDADDHEIIRENFLEQLLNIVPGSSLLVATTGFTSRELFELRGRRSEAQRDFLTVGGMGHASSIALSIAIDRHDRKVICLDGDGAMLMQLGALPVIGCGSRPENYLYLLLNNGMHESVGGQPTIAGQIDISRMAEAFGFRRFFSVSRRQDVGPMLKDACNTTGPVFFEVILKPGTRKDLGRPTQTPEENKYDFMRFISGH